MAEFIGACEYCGQIHIPENAKFATQPEANKYATDHCGCVRAVNARNRLRKISKVRSAIDAMFTAEDNAADSINTLYAVGEAICNGYIAGAKLTLNGLGTISISVSAKGKVKVSHNVAYKNELEV